MKFLEKDLETIIYEYPKQCYDRGLSLNCCRMGMKMLRQVRLGKYGVADLVSVHHYENEYGTVFDNAGDGFCSQGLRIDIIECKKGQINMNTFLQAKRYETGIRQLLDRLDTSGVFIEVDVTLIGQSFDKSHDFIHAFQSTNTQAFTYSYGPDGIEFDNQTWDCAIRDGVDRRNAPEIANKLKESLSVRFGFTPDLQRDLSLWQ